MSLLPVTSNVRMDGRSCTTTTSTRVFAPQLHVAEETGSVERTQRLANALRTEAVADVDGQRVEHRALADALQPLDANAADR